MKKNLFALIVVIAGALSISPLSIALENTSRNDGLPDVMYASNSKTEERTLSENKKYSDDSELNTDSNIAEKSTVSERKDVTSTNKKDAEYRNYEDMNNSKRESASVNKNGYDKSVKKNKVRYSGNREKIASNRKNVKEQRTYAVNDEKNAVQDVESDKALSKEEALKILESKNNKNQYKYMGDENSFNVLKEKGQEGYVFVPDANTDLGLFVNKNTKEVYTFNPSGSLDVY